MNKINLAVLSARRNATITQTVHIHCPFVLPTKRSRNPNQNASKKTSLPKTLRIKPLISSSQLLNKAVDTAVFHSLLANRVTNCIFSVVYPVSSWFLFSASPKGPSISLPPLAATAAHMTFLSPDIVAVGVCAVGWAFATETVM